jgi:uncharacterized protein involved in exopolysaccharide biosynthesis
MSIQLQPIPSPREADSLWSAGWRHKGWVACGLVLGVVIAAAVAIQLPKTYQSSAQITVIKKRPDPVTGVDTRHLTEEYVSPPQDLLRSSLIIDRAIQSKGLALLGIEVPEGQDLNEAIRNALSVTPSKGPAGQTPVYKLHFRGRDAEQCRAVLDAVLDSYREFMDSKHQAVSKDTLELILRDKQNLESEIAKTESAYRAFREKAPLLGKTKDGMELRQERLTSIQTKRSAQLLQRVELEGQLATLETALKEGRSQEVILAMLADFMRKNDAGEPGRDKIASLQDQLLPLLLEERKLEQVHGPKHPEVTEIRKRIETARRLMVLPASAWKNDLDPQLDPAKLYVHLLKEKLRHLKTADALLAGVFQAEQDEARRLAAVEIEEDAFRSRIKLNQTMYDSLVKRVNEVSLIRSAGGYQIELLESPSIGKRVAPSLALALAIGAVVGLGLGLGAASWADSRGIAKERR